MMGVKDKCQLMSDTGNDDGIVWPLSKLPIMTNVIGGATARDLSGCCTGLKIESET